MPSSILSKCSSIYLGGVVIAYCSCLIYLCNYFCSTKIISNQVQHIQDPSLVFLGSGTEFRGCLTSLLPFDVVLIGIVLMKCRPVAYGPPIFQLLLHQIDNFLTFRVQFWIFRPAHLGIAILITYNQQIMATKSGERDCMLILGIFAISRGSMMRSI
ncbi:hypothetical protein BDZ45DRAFT_305079 [Acephala macrosclerotiorum]|nr:hypothetical protein BDZ45DRAFT_305079 [Acephala macrosclerotiorum]